MRPWFVVALALTSGCSDHAPSPSPEPVVVAPPVAPRPSMVGGPVGSASGMHLDDDVGPRPTQPAAGHHGQAIDIVLRSSPSGAMAAVDGVPIGPTPTNWSGTADGRAHEFTFTRSGYAFARYRFVPITSGVIHARLEPIGEDGDAGVPPAPDRDRGRPDRPDRIDRINPIDVAPQGSALSRDPSPQNTTLLPRSGAGPQP